MFSSFFRTARAGSSFCSLRASMAKDRASSTKAAIRRIFSLRNCSSLVKHAFHSPSAAIFGHSGPLGKSQDAPRS